MINSKINILLATYNGEKYISELLNSIIKQTFTNWVLLIRDDNSTDNTVELIENYSIKYSNKIKLIKNDSNINKGPVNNFSSLIEKANGDYIFFCDQDDVWCPNKIEISLKRLKLMEQKYSSKTPCLIYTDLFITNHKLKILSKSYYKYMNRTPNKKRFKDISLQNIMVGCTIAFNKSLLNKSIPIPKNVIMHDWWISLVASGIGKISFIDKSLIYYRQHSQNAIGANKTKNIWKRLKKLFPWEENKHFTIYINKILYQTEIFYNKYNHILDKDKIFIIQKILSLKDNDFLQRAKIMYKYKLFRNNLLETLELLFRY